MMAMTVETISHESAVEGYNLAEEENDRLRFIVAWCAKRMPKEHLPELARMVRQKTVEDGHEEDREDYLRLRKHIERLTDLVQIMCDKGKEVPTDWYAKADAAANQLRGYLDTELRPSLHEVRNHRRA